MPTCGDRPRDSRPRGSARRSRRPRPGRAGARARSGRRAARASPSSARSRAPTSGTAAISSAGQRARDLLSRPLPSSTQGTAISIAAKASSGAQYGSSRTQLARAAAIGSSSSAAIAVRAEHERRRAEVAHGDLDQEVGDPPDHAHRREQDRAARHAPRTLGAPQRLLRVGLGRLRGHLGAALAVAVEHDRDRLFRVVGHVEELLVLRRDQAVRPGARR